MTEQEQRVSMPLQDAVEHKFEAGRAKYRKPGEPFQGDPLLELFDDLLDSYAYCAEVERSGRDVTQIWGLVTEALILTQAMLQPPPKDSAA
jgi:hypothetical protein